MLSVNNNMYRAPNIFVIPSGSEKISMKKKFNEEVNPIYALKL